MSEPVVRVEGLTKIYGDKVAIEDVNLHVDRGETFVIVGASGSGKSVLLRNMVGLERPTRGHVYVDGIDVTELKERELRSMIRRFGIVFQRNALFDSLTVFENVAYPLEELSVDRHTIERRVMDELRALGVDDAADKLPSEISGGMAKRVGIARALVTRPEILVYDEPTAGLDPVTSRRVDALIEENRERSLVTSIVVTHDIATAFGVGDRFALIESGHIVFEAPVEHAFEATFPAARHFFDSSAVDPNRVLSRAGRSTPAQIEARWLAHNRETLSPETTSPAHG